MQGEAAGSESRIPDARETQRQPAKAAGLQRLLVAYRRAFVIGARPAQRGVSSLQKLLSWPPIF